MKKFKKNIAINLHITDKKNSDGTLLGNLIVKNKIILDIVFINEFKTENNITYDFCYFDADENKIFVDTKFITLYNEMNELAYVMLLHEYGHYYDVKIKTHSYTLTIDEMIKAEFEADKIAAEISSKEKIQNLLKYLINYYAKTKNELLIKQLKERLHNVN